MPGEQSRRIDEEESVSDTVGREIGQYTERTVEGKQSRRGCAIHGRYELPGNAVRQRIPGRQPAAKRNPYQ